MEMAGKRNEDVAIAIFSEIKGLNVAPSGIFVSTLYGFLAASPDGNILEIRLCILTVRLYYSPGIINDHNLVEVKCSAKLASLNLSLEDAVRTKQIAYLDMNKEGEIFFKQNHDYFYQVKMCSHKFNISSF